MSIEVHSTAIVDSNAKIAADVSIGPYSIIGPNVSIGAGTKIGPHVVVDGHTTIGENNQIFQFASLGSSPQDLKYKGEPSELHLGDNNTIREYVTLQPGTQTGSMVSRIGNNNLFMVGSHVGHDAVVGDSNVFANYCCLAGHVTIESRVTIGGLSGIHQFVRIGQLSILGAGAMVAQDVPPFCIAQGDHAKLLGINRVGVSRAGYSSQEITHLRKLYRQLFWSKKLDRESSGGESGSSSLSKRIEEMEKQVAGFTAGSLLIQFLKSESKRGVASANRKNQSNEDASE